MASPFDIFSKTPALTAEKDAAKPRGMFAMMKVIEDNKAMLEGLPAAMDQWGRFCQFSMEQGKTNATELAYVKGLVEEIAGAISVHTETLRMMRADLTRVISILEPGGISPEIYAAMAAEAAADPRNAGEHHDPGYVMCPKKPCPTEELCFQTGCQEIWRLQQKEKDAT